ncbi:MAG: LpqB family beta-propeller domain-containing protein [Marmoricola sp.]
MKPRSTPRTGSVALVALLLVLTACGALPESGPVQHESAARAVAPDDGQQFDAPGPGRGDTPDQVANGFLTAMTGNTATTTVARSFLSKSARAEWNPARSTLIYQVSSVRRATDGTVGVRLSDAHHLDSRGGWLGSARRGDRRLSLSMVREGGEWRIANPPDAVVIPEWYFARWYRPFNLYFFDQTERILVPDRVYVRRGDQTSSTLVRALLSGPGSDVAAVTRTEFPPQTQLDLSVPVAPDGTAEVPFSEQLLKLSSQKLVRAVAQLSWTLRQVPGLTRIRLTVGDAAVPLPDGRRDFSVQEGDAFAPTVRGASDQLVGLRDGKVVAIRGGAEEAVPGPFGRSGYSLRSIAARLDGKALAAVASDRRTVFVGPGSAAVGKGKSSRVKRIYAGTDVLRPSYDMFGDVWLVDNVNGRSRVLHVAGGREARVDIPGISGHGVKAFVVSRDGTRLVAVVDGAGRGDRLVTAALLRSADGAFSRATAATEIDGVPSDLGDLRDVVWRSPNDLAVLGRPAKDVSQVAFVSLDGSPGDPTTIPPDSWPGNAIGLAGSPDPSLPLYLVTPTHQLLRLDGSSRWRGSSVSRGLLVPAYVG